MEQAGEERQKNFSCAFIGSLPLACQYTQMIKLGESRYILCHACMCSMRGIPAVAQKKIEEQTPTQVS